MTMKTTITSLLVGSAAALAFMPGARAADAIVAAEPEPVEYVRVCEAYGTGYFYIPGTETCLKVGGRVRFDLHAANTYTPNSALGWRTRSRAELYLDSASDTEYGPLKTKVTERFDFEGTYNDGVHTVTKLIAANIQLAGFLVGLADSQYSSFLGYAGDVIHEDIVSYGGFEINQISYVYQGGNGVSAMVSLQDNRGAITGRDAFGNTLYASGDDYGVDVVAGLGFKADAFQFRVVGGYDENAEEGAVKARIDGTFGNVSAFLMGAWNTDGDSVNAFAPGDSIGQSWGDWALWTGVNAKLSDTLAANLQLAYTDNETFSAAANLKWNPVQGLLVQPEISYSRWENIDEDQWNGTIRFQRTF